MRKEKLYKITLGLAIFTIFYNLVEGLFAVFWGAEEESLTLFGFGLDSFVELISGIGVAHAVWRIRRSPDSLRDGFERLALRITGVAFYLLVAGLTFSALASLSVTHQPVTTFWGIVISLISLLVMWVLVIWKRKVGRLLNSAAIIADANCTLVCMYMSLILLTSSVIYAFFRIPYVDALGTIGLAYFAFIEGKECFEKATSDKHCGCSRACDVN